MRFYHPFCLILFSAILLLSNSAESLAITEIDLDEAIRLAIENSEILKAKKEKVEADNAGVRIAFSNFLPNLRFDTTAARTGGLEIVRPPLEVETQQDVNSFEFGLKAQQTIFSGFRGLFDYKGARASRDASEMNVENEKQRLSLEVQGAFYQLLLTEQEIQAALLQRNLLKKELPGVRDRFEKKEISELELLAFEVDYADSESLLLELQDSDQTQKMAFSSLLGKPGLTDFRLKGTLEPIPLSGSSEELVKAAFQQRADLKGSRLSLDQLGYQVKSSYSDFLPVINLGASYGFSQQSLLDDKDYDEFWRIHATLSMPLFDGLASIAKLNRAKALRTAQERELTHLERDIALSVRKAYDKVEGSRRQIQYTSKSASSLERFFHILQKEYEEKKVDPSDYSGALSAQTKAKNAHLKALYTYQTAKIDLARAIGDAHAFR
ncbi:MAG: TolC family protein [Deltaproteobacteria bacterium]|nr:TolC family protein [Deltaproteobacteria bacterium]